MLLQSKFFRETLFHRQPLAPGLKFGKRDSFKSFILCKLSVRYSLELSKFLEKIMHAIILWLDLNILFNFMYFVALEFLNCVSAADALL